MQTLQADLHQYNTSSQSSIASIEQEINDLQTVDTTLQTAIQNLETNLNQHKTSAQYSIDTLTQDIDAMNGKLQKYTLKSAMTLY